MLIAVFIAFAVYAIWAVGSGFFSAFIGFVQPNGASVIWWKGALLILFAGGYGVFVQNAENKNILLDSSLFLSIWFFLGVALTRFVGFDLMVIPVVLTVTLTFIVLRIRQLRGIETKFSRKLNELTHAGELLESQEGDLRVESGLKLLKTVLPLSEIIVFRLEPNGELYPVGRSRNGGGKETTSSRQNSWQENVALCENALNTRKTIIQTDGENKDSAKVALPLVSDNKVLGGLFVDIKQNFERNDQYLLEAFCEQLARNFQRSELSNKDLTSSFWKSSLSPKTLNNRLDMISLINGVIKEQSFGSVATSYLKEAHAIAYLDGTVAYINKQLRELAEIKPQDICEINLFGLLDKFKTDVFNEPSIAIRRVLQTGNAYQCELQFPDTNKTLDLQITLVRSRMVRKIFTIRVKLRNLRVS